MFLEHLWSKHYPMRGSPDTPAGGDTPPTPTQRCWHLASYLRSAQMLHKPPFRQLLGVHPKIENPGDNPNARLFSQAADHPDESELGFLLSK
mgnify:CR=1 FL=1